MLPLELYALYRKRDERVLSYSRELEALLGDAYGEPSEMERLNRFVSRSSSFRVVNYGEYKDFLFYYKLLSVDDYFRYPILATMRGSVLRVYEGGDVKQVAFPFTKFFNYKETERSSELPRKGYIITEKLDGTLIIVWRDPDTGGLRFNTRGMMDYHNVRLFTRGGVTGMDTRGKITNPYVIRFVNSVRRMGLWEELESIVRDGRTVMFELVYKVPASHQLGVEKTPVDSPDWKPYLLAYRDHKTMEIIYPDDTLFPIPQRYSVHDVDDVPTMVEHMRGKEGVVVYYPNLSYVPGVKWWNYMVKIKNSYYMLTSKAVSTELSWKGLAKAVIGGVDDDLIPYLDDEKREFVREYKKAIISLDQELQEFLDLIVKLRRKRGKSVDNMLAHSLGMGYVVRALEEGMKTPGANLKEYVLKTIANKVLLQSNKKKALLGAVEHYKNKLRRAKIMLEKNFGEKESIPA